MQWIALSPGSADPADTGTLQWLAWRALRFTPHVCVLDEAVLLEVATQLRLFGGLDALLRRLLGAEGMGHDGAAPPQWNTGPTALQALARLRAGWEPGRHAQRPATELPLHSLSAARPHLPTLEPMGCRTWADVLRLPREGMARRFGQGLLDALDQAQGHRPHPLAWITPPPRFDQRLDLPAPVDDAPALMFGVNRLLRTLDAWLAARQQGVLALRLQWRDDRRRTSHGGTSGAQRPAADAVLLRSARPTRDMAHLGQLAAEQLARTVLAAPVVSLRLRSIQTASLQPVSASLLPGEAGAPGQDLHQLIERIHARLGEHSVLRWQARSGHQPESAQAWVPAQLAWAERAPRCGAAPAAPQTTPAAALLPAWLLARPQRLALRAERPVWQGEALSLRLGPQRLETSHWAAQAGVRVPGGTQRDYFIAHSRRHGLLWIFRERVPPAPGAAGDAGDSEPDGLARWYLHGLFE